MISDAIASPDPADPALGWDSFVESFLESTFSARPDLAVRAGRHELDGRLPDWSREGLEREADRLRGERRRASGFEAARLDGRRRFERDYVLARIEHDLFWIDRAAWPLRNPTFYAEALDPNVYVTRPYAPPLERLEAYVRHLRALPAALAEIRDNLRLPLPRTYAEVGRITFGGLAAYVRDHVPAAFATLLDGRLPDSFLEATASAAAALTALDDWLAREAPRSEDGFRLGPDLFAEMLRATEAVDVPLEALEEAGRHDLERNLAALRAACDEIAPGRPVAECLARVQGRKPPGGPFAGARRQLAELKRFVLESGLVAVPGSEDALVEESPPYMRWNFAYIDIPGPYERGLPATYYIASPDPRWSEAERLAYLPGETDLLFTSVHEVWPGHFLQFLHSNRAASRFGQVFVGYGFAEGWAHYAEELILEAGFGGGDPEIRVGQLLNALLRDVRYLVSIGLHTRGMELGEAERLFREMAFQDPVTARQQAARGTFDPAFLNYTLGKLMLRKLRADWTAGRGGRSAWAAFHDRLLAYGGPPIPLLRRELLGDRDAGALLE